MKRWAAGPSSAAVSVPAARSTRVGGSGTTAEFAGLAPRIDAVACALERDTDSETEWASNLLAFGSVALASG